MNAINTNRPSQIQKLSLRERAAALKASAARIMRRPPVASPAERPEPAGDEVSRPGLVLYEDASGKLHQRPVAHWIAFMAARLNAVASTELNRQFNAISQNDPDQDADEIYDRLREELRIDALHDLAFRSDQVFNLCRGYAVGHRWRMAGKDAKISADSIDLSGLDIRDLCGFYEALESSREYWGALACQPRSTKKTYPEGCVDRTPFGDRADFEDSRAGHLMDRIVGEATKRAPVDDSDRNKLFALRIRHEIACEGRIRDPKLLADITQAWG